MRESEARGLLSRGIDVDYSDALDLTTPAGMLTLGFAC